ncbi:FYN-binding protein 1 isoform X3 [Rhinopithecus roxellana]|uniref:FYN-binding protein 1 n=1 Tax=Rhinopithecus bieti TaxID=61621 RepID=A0A2K6K0A7_RHIBE|nr:FYN-binding protein 1 isoform X2 [Rhinopithecus roxellana]XP_030783784.1 FYN-binding protein 1 isoform X2 [Rhinopithecus roxellana]XP_030783785.1 FYN-binding protein 1 isoform X3 [Rhinopithecus roxellana]
MDAKPDVKSLMAKFNTGGNPTEDVSVNSRPFRVTGPNSSSGIQARKNLFNNQGNASPPAGPSSVPKFGSPKPPVAVKPSSEEKPDKEPKPPFLKPTGAGQRFGTPANLTTRDPEAKVGFPKPVGPKPINLPKEDSKPAFPWPPGNKPSLHSVNQDHDLKPLGPKSGPTPPTPENEQKQAFPKLAGVKGKFMSASQDLESKPLFPKPAFGQKPPLSTENSHEDESPVKNASPSKGSPAPLGVRSKSGPLKPAREDPENKDHAGEISSSPFPGVVLKPVASRGGSGLSKNGEEKKEDRKIDAAKNTFQGKTNQEDSASGAPPSRFPKAPSKLTVEGPWGQSQEKEKGDKNSATPKQKPLPPLFTLGPPPPKPNRPPNVDLTKFLKTSSGNSTSKGQMSYSTTSPPLPPPSHPASQPPLPASHPSQPPVPSLPPRNIKPPFDLKNSVNEDNQDGVMHSDGAGNLDEEQESEGETYEDIEASKEREKKREKEEKKRLELEKKEQKEKEKKEQEIKKKFKLTGPIQVIHLAKACCDVKGGKNELSFKQGEQIEIIRITDNPEGKWLGRTARGSYGYIKTTAVEIDYDSLKLKKDSLGAPSRPIEDDQEVYDDVAEQDNISSHSQSGSGGIFPPPPDDDIYDGIEEEDADDGSTLQVQEKSNTWSWGILKMLKGKDDKKKSIREKPKVSESDNNEGSSFPAPPKQLDMGDEVYDDVDTSDFPISSAEMSQGANIGKAKTEEKDLKKLKKQEKEEKDFRKKFKYDGEIRVLYSTKVTTSVTSKKWGTRDLQVKPGESLEVIQNTDDTKVLCRNEEGKYGYVLRSYLADNDGEIYDDIADGCIYDND